MRPKPLEKRITDMLIQDPLPKITLSHFVSIRTGVPETVSVKFPGLRDAMNEIENNAKKSDTDKSLDDKRIKKLHEYFNRTVDNKKPLLNELHKVYNAWVTEQESLSETMRMLRHNGYDKKYIKSFNEAEKVLSDLDEYLKLVTGEDSSDDAAADSDMATAAVSLAMDDDSDTELWHDAVESETDGDRDELDPVHVIGTVVPRNAQPRNIITVPGRVVAASSAASSAASLITRAGRKLRTRKSKIQHKKSHHKKSKTHRKKQHKKTHRKY